MAAGAGSWEVAGVARLNTKNKKIKEKDKKNGEAYRGKLKQRKTIHFNE